jgi:glycosyltransferase involved in cell wall biosynthesis
VVDVNQSVYLELRRRGWDVRIVVPDRWRHEYAAGTFPPQALPGLEDALIPLPVIKPGLAQRHAYVARLAPQLRAFRPDVAFLEQEAFSVAALQWSLAARRAGVPFGVQVAENMDRPFPAAARAIRRIVLPRAAFVAARSPAAGRLAGVWGARGKVGVAAHAVPTWPPLPHAGDGVFTVGYAGRLVPEKGIDDLLAALVRLEPPVRLLVAGAGELEQRVRDAARPGFDVELLTGLAHDAMAEQYARMDVLALPSRTTPTWTEQFGRVLVEAMSQHVPVVATATGEIPWVVETTGGGVLVPEGDAPAFAAALERLRRDPEERRRLGETGAAAVARTFTVEAATDQLEALIDSVRPSALG